MKKQLYCILSILSFACHFSLSAQVFAENPIDNEFLNTDNNAPTCPYEADCEPACSYEAECGRFTIGADWLYWKVEQDKMQIGSVVDGSASTETTTAISASVLKPKFKTNSGFRVFADYITSDQNWNLEAAFTHVPGRGNINFDNAGTSVFASLFVNNFPIFTTISNASFNSLTSRWRDHIDYFDLDLARRISICKNIQIKPHLGIRAIWIDQTLEIGGIGIIQQDPAPLPLVFDSRLKTRMEGIGVEGGIWGAWSFNYGISLVGHFGGSLVYANAHNTSDFEGTISNGIVDLNFRDHNHISLPSVDSFIGLVFSKDWSKTLISVHVGWEHHVIFDTNEFSISGGGKTTMQGLTFGGSVTF